MKRLAVLALALTLCLGGVALWFFQSSYHRIGLWMASGVTAKQVCSLYFITGMAPEKARALYLDPQLLWARDLVDVALDREAASATTSVFGLYEQTALYREGLGCTLVREHMADPGTPIETETWAANPLRPANPARYDRALIDEALDRAFEEPETEVPGSARNTLAVLALHEGRVLAERYAAGIDADTPLLGWSMAKSATATLAGVLVQRGEVDLYAPGAVAAPADPRITLDHLLRMTPGLAMEERNDGTDPNSEMLFVTDDIAAFAASRAQIHEPGTHWSYMSGSTNLAMRYLQDHLPADDLQGQLSLIDRYLFAPLGMTTAVFEADAQGTIIGSSYLWASARDWARLGQLYLDEGRVGDRQLIPPDWRTYVGTRTEASKSYGSGFWLYRRSEPLPEILDMNGFQGQNTVIVPEFDLVIVRLGATNHQGAGSTRLVKDLVEVVQGAQDADTAGLSPP